MAYANTFDTFQFISFIELIFYYLFDFNRRNRVYQSQVNDWTWFVTRWNFETRNCLHSSRPRPWNWKKNSNRIQWPVQHHQVVAVTSVCSHSGINNSMATHRPRRPLRHRIRWANRPQSQANSKSGWWAVRICLRTFRAVRVVIRPIRVPTTSNPLSKVTCHSLVQPKLGEAFNRRSCIYKI